MKTFTDFLNKHLDEMNDMCEADKNSKAEGLAYLKRIKDVVSKDKEFTNYTAHDSYGSLVLEPKKLLKTYPTITFPMASTSVEFRFTEPVLGWYAYTDAVVTATAFGKFAKLYSHCEKIARDCW